MKKWTLVQLTLLFLFSQINAQNLIPNSSFEDIKKEIVNPYSHFAYHSAAAEYEAGYYQTILPPWQNNEANVPYIIDAKYRKAPQKKGLKLDVTAHEGEVMLGFNVPNGETSTLFIELNQPTEKGAQYTFECWVAYSMYTKFLLNGIDIYFTNNPTIDHAKIISEDIEPISIINEEGDFELKKWIKLSATFEADTTSRYLMLGVMNPMHGLIISTTRFPQKNLSQTAFIYLDNLSLVQSSESELIETAKTIGQDSSKAHPMLQDKINISNVKFKIGTTTIEAKSKKMLRELAATLKTYKNPSVNIRSFTDASGSAAFNKKMSTKRAKSIHDYLISQGVDAKIMTYKGYGEQFLLNPKKPNSSVNRRVEIIVTHDRE